MELTLGFGSTSFQQLQWIWPAVPASWPGVSLIKLFWNLLWTFFSPSPSGGGGWTQTLDQGILKGEVSLYH